MRLYDNTRLKGYKQCNRRYLFRHVFDWASGGMAVAPGFGLCWHSAMDHLWPNIAKPPEALLQSTFSVFMKEWAEQEMPNPLEDNDDLLKFRTPDTAARMIEDYYYTRKEFISDYKVVAVEMPFCVPLDPKDTTVGYVGRLDKVIGKGDSRWIVDHKTTSQYRVSGGIASSVTDSFTPDSQVDGYLYAGHMMWGKDFKGVWMDLALVHKKESRFGLVPVQRRLEHLDEWLWEAQEGVRRIEQDNKNMTLAVPTDSYLAAFPKTTDACYDFQSPCPYLDTCKMYSNPLASDVPPGMEVSKWDPFTPEQLKQIEEIMG